MCLCGVLVHMVAAALYVTIQYSMLQQCHHNVTTCEHARDWPSCVHIGMPQLRHHMAAPPAQPTAVLSATYLGY